MTAGNNGDKGFIIWLPTSPEAWSYITDHDLNYVARENGATVGVRKARNGRGGYEVFSTPATGKDNYS
jgi:hypothetical protein